MANPEQRQEQQNSVPAAPASNTPQSGEQKPVSAPRKIGVSRKLVFRKPESHQAVPPKGNPAPERGRFDLKNRDDLFHAFMGRVPTQEEYQHLDKLGVLMGIGKDESLWYNVILGEMYEERLKKRLDSIDRVASNAADKALQIIARSVVDKADELAAAESKGFAWRSWALFMTPVILLCAIVFNAGFVMGSGTYPFWVRPQSTLHLALSWFLNVPSGWLFLIGCAPSLWGWYKTHAKEIFLNERLSRVSRKENLILYAKSLGCLILLGFITFLVLYTTGISFIFQRFTSPF